MIQSVVDFFIKDNEVQEGGQETNKIQRFEQSYHIQTGQTSNMQDHYPSYRVSDNESQMMVGQHSYVNQNTSVNSTHVNVIHNPTQKQHNSLTGGNSMNQSVLSIKTKANKEQQYVYCPTHTEYFITNICASKECIEPLCPECIVGHNELHVYNQTSSQLQNIQSARDVSSMKIDSLLNQLGQERTHLIPQLQKSMTDGFKRNVDTLNSLKQCVMEVVHAHFQEAQERMNENYNKSKELVESLNAVLFQRIDYHSTVLNDLLSPLYIKALIENMENPTSFAVESMSFSHIAEAIKDNNSFTFIKAPSVEESLRLLLPSFYSYQKKQKIFQSPLPPLSVNKQSNISPIPTTVSLHKHCDDITTISSQQNQVKIHQGSSSLQQTTTLAVQNQNSTFLSPLLSQKRNGSHHESVQSSKNIRQHSAVNPIFQRNSASMNNLSSRNKGNSLGRDVSSKQVQEKNVLFFQNQSSQLVQHQKSYSVNRISTSKLDFPMNRERICEEDFVGGGKNDFLDSFTEEDMNGGEKGKDEEGEEMIPISCEIKRIGREQDEENTSNKQFYIFIEGTKIFHKIIFEEYLNFPKSALTTDFLDIDFKIPINHTAFAIPNSLILITGGIMYETNKRKSIRDVYKYNEEFNTLDRVSSMIYARSQHALAYTHGRLYAISGCSGYDESSSITKCEYFNVEEGKWIEIAECLHRASGAGLTSFNKNYLYKFGGKDDLVKPVNFIECYDIQKNQWKEVQFNLPLNVNNSLSFYPFVKQINSKQILICGGYQHSIKMEHAYTATVNDTSTVSDITFIKINPLPNQCEFQYSQSFINHNQLFILKNSTKISQQDDQIFLVFNGSSWNSK